MNNSDRSSKSPSKFRVAPATLVTYCAVGLLLGIQIIYLVAFQVMRAGFVQPLVPEPAVLQIKQAQPTASELAAMVAAKEPKARKKKRPRNASLAPEVASSTGTAAKVVMSSKAGASAMEQLAFTPQQAPAADVIRLDAEGKRVEGKKAARLTSTAKSEISGPRLAAPIQPPPVAAAKQRQYINIASVEQSKLPVSKDIEEMRMLRIVLRLLPGTKEVDAEKVSVIVTFYDWASNSDFVVPSKATVTMNPAHLSPGAWREGERHEVTATYLVPKGFRKRELLLTNKSLGYYGFVVRVFYEGRWQDEEARPRTLVGRM